MTDTSQSRINAKRRVQEYLSDPAVAAAMMAVEKSCIATFEAGKTSAELFQAQSMLRAVRGLARELVTVVDNGTVEEIERERADIKAQKDRRP